MHPATPIKLLLVALGLCMSDSAFGQVFDLSAGASTLYGAGGASVAIHGANSETSIGVGLINHHVGVGASSTTRALGGLLTAGQQQLSMELPTDIFGGGPILSGIGAGYHTAPGKGRMISGFLGMSSMESGTPLFQASSHLESPAAYVQLRQPITDSLTSVSTALFTTRTGSSVLESLSWMVSRPVLCAFTAGVGKGDPYAAASIVVKKRDLTLDASYVLAGDAFQRGADPDLAISEPTRENASAEYHLTRSFTLSALHRNYISPVTSGDNGLTDEVTPASSIRSSLDEAAIQYHRSSTVLSFTMLHSRTRQLASGVSSEASTQNAGFSAGFTHRIRNLEWNENWYVASNNGGTPNAFLVSGITANLNPHLRLTEAVTNSASGPSFAHGGALITRFSSFEVDYQLLYLATRSDHPFQQAMVFDSKIQIIRDLWLQATSSVGPTGATLYTFRMGKQFAHAASEVVPLASASFGDNIVRGRVVDQHGAPVEGASLRIDSTEVYTDSKGMFFFREKASRVHSLSVVLEDFMQMGTFSVMNAPNSVHSAPEQNAQPLTITVRRIMEAESPQGSKSGSAPATRRPLPASSELPQ